MAGLSFDDLVPQQPQGGMTFDDLVPPPASTGSDILKSGATGAAKGLLSLPTTLSDLSGLADYGMSYTAAKIASGLGLLPKGKTADDFIAAAQKMNLPEARFSAPTSQGVLNAVQQDVTGPLYQPQTTAGKYAETVGSFLPMAAATGGSALGATGAGLLSEYAGQKTEGTPYETLARMGGAAIGGNASGLASRAVTPLPASASRLPLLATAEREGVPLTAGQASGYKPLQWAEASLGDMPFSGGKTGAIQEAQREAFTQAAMKRAGAADSMATPDEMAAAKTNLGSKFNDLASRNTLQFDQQLGNDIIKVAHGYDTSVPVSQQRPVVREQLVDLVNFQGSGMPGTQYQDFRSRLTKLAEGFRQSDPQTAEALRGIRNALDDAMTRSISPEDAFAWKEVRGQYKNYKALEKAAGGAGEATAQGYISPLQLRTAVAGQNKGAYVRGEGDLAELSRMGVGLLSPLPQSGTGPRSHIMHMLSMAGPITGALVGGAEHGAAGAAAGAGLGAVMEPLGGAISGRVLMSPLMQKYLGNQVMTRAGLAGIGDGPYFGLLGSDPSVQDRLRQRGLLQQ